MNDGSLFCAVMRAHLLTDLSYMSWVPAYKKIVHHHTVRGRRVTCDVVGGHWRRKAHCKRTLDALSCVCKQEPLAEVEPHFPPVGRKRNR